MLSTLITISWRHGECSTWRTLFACYCACLYVCITPVYKGAKNSNMSKRTRKNMRFPASCLRLCRNSFLFIFRPIFSVAFLLLLIIISKNHQYKYAKNYYKNPNIIRYKNQHSSLPFPFSTWDDKILTHDTGLAPWLFLIGAFRSSLRFLLISGF